MGYYEFRSGLGIEKREVERTVARDALAEVWANSAPKREVVYVVPATPVSRSYRVMVAEGFSKCCPKCGGHMSNAEKFHTSLGGAGIKMWGISCPACEYEETWEG